MRPQSAQDGHVARAVPVAAPQAYPMPPAPPSVWPDAEEWTDRMQRALALIDEQRGQILTLRAERDEARLAQVRYAGLRPCQECPNMLPAEAPPGSRLCKDCRRRHQTKWNIASHAKRKQQALARKMPAEATRS